MAMSDEQKKSQSERMKEWHRARRQEQKMINETARNMNAERPAGIPEGGVKQYMTAPKDYDPVDESDVPPDLFNGDVRRLEVRFKDPDYFPYWALEEQLNGMLSSAWEFAQMEDVEMNPALVSRNMHLGTCVCTPADVSDNPGPNGPRWHYLMKKRGRIREIHEQRRLDKSNAPIGMIFEGTFMQTPGDGRYTAKNPPPGGTSIPPIGQSQKTVR